MNAAAPAAQPTSGSVLNRIEDGRGDFVEVHNPSQSNSSVQAEIFGVRRSAMFQGLENHQTNFGHFKPEDISSMLPSYSGGAEEDVNHFIAVLENTKQALNVSSFVMSASLVAFTSGFHDERLC